MFPVSLRFSPLALFAPFIPWKVNNGVSIGDRQLASSFCKFYYAIYIGKFIRMLHAE